jgi:hypothetical protein
VPGQAGPAGTTRPGGYFGDPQLLVLESRDPDSETRNFSPVTLDTEGVKVRRRRAVALLLLQGQRVPGAWLARWRCS